MRTERVNELKANMKSFGKDAYQKSELLDEMFALQQEIVSRITSYNVCYTKLLRIAEIFLCILYRQ